MKFTFAKVTNSRLMGSIGLVIGWIDENEKNLYQYFLLDAEGLGISDYVGIYNPTKEEAMREEDRLMGGLGADRIIIPEEEALFLVQFYGKKNTYYEKPLPGDIDEYIDIIENHKSNLTINDIFPKICKSIDDEIEFINYMTMRFIAWDKESLMYFSDSEEISNMHITNINGTLLKTYVQSRGNNKYVSEALYEDSDGYYRCEIAFSIRNDDGIFKINAMLFSGKDIVYDFEVFDEIAKEEHLSIYTLENCEEFVEKFHMENAFASRDDIDEGTLFTRFNFNNNHVKDDIYVINNDLKALYYQIGDNLFVGTYSEKDKKYINKLLQCNYSEYLSLKEELYFDEHVLFDFVESGSDDFYDYLD